MQPNKDNKSENLLDFKGTIHELLQEEEPKLSQEEAIKAYREENTERFTKSYKKISKSVNMGNNEDDDDFGEVSEETEHLKRLKMELLASLERVNILAKKIFGEKEKDTLKDIKIKNQKQKETNKAQQKEIIQDNEKADEERSRE